MSYYAALIDRAADGGYGVVFPDAPGCTSAGDTFDEAVANAGEALRDWVEVSRDAGDVISAPRSPAEVAAVPEVARALASGSVMVAVPLVARRGRTVRVQVTMDEGVLDAVDEAARRTGENRSAFLARAAEQEIRRRDEPDAKDFVDWFHKTISEGINEAVADAKKAKRA